MRESLTSIITLINVTEALTKLIVERDLNNKEFHNGKKYGEKILKTLRLFYIPCLNL